MSDLLHQRMGKLQSLKTKYPEEQADSDLTGGENINNGKKAADKNEENKFSGDKDVTYVEY